MFDTKALQFNLREKNQLMQVYKHFNRVCFNHMHVILSSKRLCDFGIPLNY